MFDRRRDWADIEEMATAGTLDADAIRALLTELLGTDDPRFARLSAASRVAAERRPCAKATAARVTSQP